MGGLLDPHGLCRLQRQAETMPNPGVDARSHLPHSSTSHRASTCEQELLDITGLWLDTQSTLLTPHTHRERLAATLEYVSTSTGFLPALFAFSLAPAASLRVSDDLIALLH